MLFKFFYYLKSFGELQTNPDTNVSVYQCLLSQTEKKHRLLTNVCIFCLTLKPMLPTFDVRETLLNIIHLFLLCLQYVYLSCIWKKKLAWRLMDAQNHPLNRCVHFFDTSMNRQHLHYRIIQHLALIENMYDLPVLFNVIIDISFSVNTYFTTLTGLFWFEHKSVLNFSSYTTTHLFL